MRLNINDDFLITTPTPRLQTTQLGYLWRGSQLWNKLPLELRSNKSLPNFKNKLKQHILLRRKSTTTLSTSLNPTSTVPTTTTILPTTLYTNYTYIYNNRRYYYHYTSPLSSPYNYYNTTTLYHYSTQIYYTSLLSSNLQLYHSLQSPHSTTTHSQSQFTHTQ